MIVVIDDVNGYWKKEKGWSVNLTDAATFSSSTNIPENLINIWRASYNSNVYVLPIEAAKPDSKDVDLSLATYIHKIQI